MNQMQLPLLATLLLSSSIAVASGDSCYDWCGELPNAVLLAPGNDTRGNLVLLMEDLGMVHNPIETIPFHHYAFAAEELQQPADEAAANDPLAAAAEGLGVAPEAIGEANERLRNEGFGRCANERPETVLAFLREVAAAPMTDTDRAVLAGERLRFAGLCDQAREEPAALTLSEAALPFARYLKGAESFYQGDFEGAVAYFEGLTDTANPWLAETAGYLLARVALNRAQRDLDIWSYPYSTTVDADDLRRAADLFEAYLVRYPEGRYAGSARGLFRKIHWLAGATPALTAEYQQWLNRLTPGEPVATLHFIEESEAKLSPVSTQPGDLAPAPLLAALPVLASWRSEELSYGRVPVGIEQLAPHREAFTRAGLGTMWDYLRLGHAFWVARDYPEVLALTANEPTTGPHSHLTFSRAVLRGLALLAGGKGTEAVAHWQGLLGRVEHPGQRTQAQWLLALTWLQQGELARVYAAGSPITLPGALDYLVHHAPSALLTEMIAAPHLPPHTRSLAYLQLLRQELVHGRYAEAARLLAKHPPQGFELGGDALAPLSWGGQEGDYPCPGLAGLLDALQRDPRSARLANCMGDFLRDNEWNYAPPAIADEEGWWEVRTHRWHELTGYGLKLIPPAPTSDGRSMTSLDHYRLVIDGLQEARPDDVAYALHRATTCFAYSGYNHCGDQEIPQSQRKAWFQRLKGRYKATPWAARQKYYW